MVGLITGLITAGGGGYKDVFFKGFDRVKFFRSPVISLVAGLSLSYLTSNILFSCFRFGGIRINDNRMLQRVY